MVVAEAGRQVVVSATLTSSLGCGLKKFDVERTVSWVVVSLFPFFPCLCRQRRQGDNEPPHRQGSVESCGQLAAGVVRDGSGRLQGIFVLGGRRWLKLLVGSSVPGWRDGNVWQREELVGSGVVDWRFFGRGACLKKQ